MVATATSTAWTSCCPSSGSPALVHRPGATPLPRLKVAALLLLALDRLEQRLEVAHAEAARAVALDDLEEEGRPVLDGPREDLKKVALLVPVGLHAEVFQHVHWDADVTHAVGERRVVLVRHPEELDAVLAQLPHRSDDVLRPQRDVLTAG